MSLTEKYEVERTKRDALAPKELPNLSIVPPTMDFHAFARRTRLLVGVSEFLGDLRGKRVLEYGCGLGALSVLLAKSGAEVTAFDLSKASVAVTRKRAMLNNVESEIDLAVSAGETLPFADESFDVIFGKGILHHLELELGYPDLYRVLKPGGKAVFSEPMGMNPVLNFVRAWVPYVGKHPRGADRPLNYDEIHGWGAQFSTFHYREIQLLAMVERSLKLRLPLLSRLDELLLERFPFLRRYCRYVIMYMVK